MFSVILKAVGGLIGIFAAWYISKKIAGWLTALNNEWEKFREERLRAQVDEQRKAIDEANKTTRKKIDDFLGGDGEN